MLLNPIKNCQLNSSYTYRNIAMNWMYHILLPQIKHNRYQSWIDYSQSQYITVVENVTFLAYRRFTYTNVNCFKGFFTLAFTKKRESQSNYLQRKKTSVTVKEYT